MRLNLRRLLPIFLLLLTCPAWATWSLVQTVNNGACNSASNTCTLTVSATTAGNLLVVTGRAAVGSFTAGSAGGTWVFPAACTNGLQTACGYVLSATGGITSIVISRGGSSGAWALQFREFHYTSTVGIFAETVPNAIQVTSNPASNPVTTPTPTVTGSSDVVVAMAINIGSQGISGVNSPYTDFTALNSSGGADLLNTGVATAATFLTNATANGTHQLFVLSFAEIVATVNISTVGKVSTVGNVSSE